MAEEFMERVEAALAEQHVLEGLPPEIDGYVFTKVQERNEAQYDFFRYDNKAMHRAVVGFYDAVTQSYKLRVHIGVVSFSLPSFIHGELSVFVHELARYLPSVMEDLSADRLCSQELLPIRDAVAAWAYGQALPEELEGYTLFIRPSTPAALTNGSYLIIDYADFAQGNDVGIYYNCYRNEFFGEYHAAGMPYVSYDFDAADLDELEQRLDLHLVRFLRMAAEIAVQG